MTEPEVRERAADQSSRRRTVGRWALAALLFAAGTGHLLGPDAFRAQVPPWLPAPDAVVYVSGVVELALAAALVIVRRQRIGLGWVVAAFFVLVVPGNVSQLVTRTDAFGLDSDLARGVRLALQPVLVVWALWSTGAWRAWRDRRPGGSPRASSV